MDMETNINFGPLRIMFSPHVNIQFLSSPFLIDFDHARQIQIEGEYNITRERL